MKRGTRILSFALALLILGGALVGCASVHKPLNYLKRALEKTVERRLGGFFIELLGDALEGGSIEAVYGGTDLYETPLESGSLKLSFDRENEAVCAAGKVNVGGKKYDSTVYLTAEELATTSDAFLGANRFGFRFDELTTDNVKSSFFHNASGTQFAKDWIDDQFGADLNTVKGDFFEIYTSLEDILELSDEIGELFLEALTNNAPHHRYSEKGTIYITATVGNTELSHALRETRLMVVKDRSLCKELRRLAAIRDSLESVKKGETVKEWTNRVEDFIDSSISVEELCAEIDAKTPFVLQLDAAVDRSSKMIDTATVSLDRDNVRQFSFSVDLTDKNTNVFSLTAGGATRTLTHYVQKDGMRHYKAEFFYEKKGENGELLLYAAAALQADRRKDTYTLTINKGDAQRVLNGSFDKKSDAFRFSVDGIAVNGEAHRLSFSLSVKGDDRMPDMIEYESIFTVREERYVPIDQRIQATKAELLEAWGDAPLDKSSVAAFLLTCLGLEEEISALPVA